MMQQKIQELLNFNVIGCRARFDRCFCLDFLGVNLRRSIPCHATRSVTNVSFRVAKRQEASREPRELWVMSESETA